MDFDVARDPKRIAQGTGLGALHAPAPRIRLGGRSWSTFHVLGAAGLAAGSALSLGLAHDRGLSLGVTAALILTALATFLGLVLATRRVTGEERLVYYHHEIAILAVATLLLQGLGRPVASHLDALVLGVGAFFAFGRAGCFAVGCCHGRPHRRGVRYRTEHADAGFTRSFVGVPLVPVQLLEAAWVTGTVVAGAGLVLGGAPPGAALVWYVLVYDAGRFGFEFLRGDGARPYLGGFSEAQWTSLALMLVVVGVGAAGGLPLASWHLAVPAALALAMAAVTLRRRLLPDARDRLLRASHVEEIAEALHRLARWEEDHTPPPPDAVHLARTSAGLRISTGRARDAAGEVRRHYTLSSSGGTLRDVEVGALADLLALLGGHVGGMREGVGGRSRNGGRVLRGRRGVVHLVVPATGGTGAP